MDLGGRVGGADDDAPRAALIGAAATADRSRDGHAEAQEEEPKMWMGGQVMANFISILLRARYLSPPVALKVVYPLDQARPATAGHTARAPTRLTGGFEQIARRPLLRP